jgi:Rieske 2Fe-2S family protein
MIAMHGLESAKLATRATWNIRANWKLVTENFAECYHCGPAHPEYCSVMAHALPGTTGNAKHKAAYELEESQWRERTARLGHPAGPTIMNPHYSAGRFPIGGEGKSQARDGRQVAPLMGAFKTNDQGISAIRIHPASYVIAPCDYAMVTRFTPIGVQNTLQEILWLVHPDAREGVDFDVEELAWLWKVTTDQDQTIIEDNQRGINSMGYEPGPYSETENSVDTFVSWYLRKLTNA